MANKYSDEFWQGDDEEDRKKKLTPSQAAAEENKKKVNKYSDESWEEKPSNNPAPAVTSLPVSQQPEKKQGFDLGNFLSETKGKIGDFINRLDDPVRRAEADKKGQELFNGIQKSVTSFGKSVLTETQF